MTFVAYFLARAWHADDRDRRDHSLPVVCAEGRYALPSVASEDAAAEVLAGASVALCAEAASDGKGGVIKVFVVDGCVGPVLGMASSMLSVRSLAGLCARGLVSSATREVFAVARSMFYQRYGLTLSEWVDGWASLPPRSSSPPAGHPVVAAAACPICFGGDEQEGGFLKLAACAHVFHAACIAEWCRRSASCPLCRRGVITTPG
jgi:hypothetical protein